MNQEKMDKYFMGVAKLTSQLSHARRTKVGAVMTKDNRIISIGINGTPHGFDNNCEDTEKKFVNFLETHSNDFVDVRYYVAHEGWQGMSPIMVYTYTYNIGNKTKYLLSNWETVVDG